MFFKVTTTPVPPDPKVSDTDFKEFSAAINKNTAWCSMEPYVEEAEDFEIIPAISQEFYDVLNNEYQSSGTIDDPVKAKTFKYLKKSLANFTSYIALMRLNVRFGDAGANETASQDVQPIRQWVLNGNRWEIVKAAYKYLDMALEHMESQVEAGNADYDAFKNSEAYTISRELLIPNATTFQNHYNIKTSRRAYTLLRPYIRKAEVLKIKPLLCELYDEIKTQFQENTLTAKNEAILPAIQRLLAEYTLQQAVPDLNFVNDGEGLLISENVYDAKPESNTISQGLQQMLTRSEHNAAIYETQLMNTIYAALDDYPTFRDGSCNDLTEDSDDDGIPDVDCYEDPEPGAFII
jgi:hypothetical protein